MSVIQREESFYELLEVAQDASAEQIEASYRRITSYVDPDGLAVYSILDADEAAEIRAQLDEAYRTLSDPSRRAAYDRGRGSGYPSVLVPEAKGDTSMSVGHVQGEHDTPPVDVEAIFRDGGGISTSPLSGRSRALLEDEEDTEVGLGRLVSARRDAASARSDAGLAARRPVLLPSANPRGPSPSLVVAREREAHAVREPSPTIAAPVAEARLQPLSPPAAEPVAPPPPAPLPVAASAPVLMHASSTPAGARDPGAREHRLEDPPRPPQPIAPPKPYKRLRPSPSIELTPDTEFSGSLLRRLRESVPAGLEDVAEITKVRKHYLAAIEGHDFAALPAPVYVRGFVVEYARALGLDSQRVAQSYMSLYKRLSGRG